jgi:hypothetical protein
VTYLIQALFLFQGGQWTNWEIGEGILLFVVMVGSATLILLSRRSQATEAAQDKALKVQTDLATAQEKRAELAERTGQAHETKVGKLQEDLDATLLEYKELVQVDMQQFVTNYKEMGRIAQDVMVQYRELMQETREWRKEQRP